MEIHRLWFLSPIAAVALALTLLALDNGTGLDGAARATAMLFWFLPVALWLGYKSLASFNRVDCSTLVKCLLIAVWLIPSIPLSLMSLYGITLLSETGFDILF